MNPTPEDIRRRAALIILERTNQTKKGKDPKRASWGGGTSATTNSEATPKKKSNPKSTAKSDFNKAVKQAVLKKFREKSDRSVNQSSSPTSSCSFLSQRRPSHSSSLPSSCGFSQLQSFHSDGVRTARSSSLSSQSSLDDSSTRSQRFAFATPSSSFDTTELREVVANVVLNERSAPRSSVSMDELLQSVLSRELRSLEERDERLSIMGSPKYSDFYRSLFQHLYCMIASCEVLSSGKVQIGNCSQHGSNLVRSLNRMLLQKDSLRELVSHTRPGMLIADSVQSVTKNLSAIPFADAIGSIIRLVVAVKDEREQHVSIQRVAEFASIVSLSESTTGTALENGLRITVEHIARTMIRALCYMPQFDRCSGEFGKIKQFLLQVLGEECTNTPAKEEAYKAANCIMNHIMQPRNNGRPSFVDIARSSSVAVHEVLVAEALNVEWAVIHALPRFSCAA